MGAQKSVVTNYQKLVKDFVGSDAYILAEPVTGLELGDIVKVQHHGDKVVTVQLVRKSGDIKNAIRDHHTRTPTDSLIGKKTGGVAMWKKHYTVKLGVCAKDTLHNSVLNETAKHFQATEKKADVYLITELLTAEADSFEMSLKEKEVKLEPCKIDEAEPGRLVYAVKLVGYSTLNKKKANQETAATKQAPPAGNVQVIVGDHPQSSSQAEKKKKPIPEEEEDPVKTEVAKAEPLVASSGEVVEDPEKKTAEVVEVPKPESPVQLAKAEPVTKAEPVAVSSGEAVEDPGKKTAEAEKVKLVAEVAVEDPDKVVLEEEKPVLIEEHHDEEEFIDAEEEDHKITGLTEEFKKASSSSSISTA